MSDITDRLKIERLADAKMKTAVERVQSHDCDMAIADIRKALKLLKSINSIEKYVEYLNILGMVYAIAGDEQTAFDCYLESLATAEIMRSRDLKAMVYSNIGMSYRRMGRTEDASRYFNDAETEYLNATAHSEEMAKLWDEYKYVSSAISGC